MAPRKTGLSALECDARLDSAEKKRWVDLCANYHTKSEAAKAAYAQRQMMTPWAPDYNDYAALKEEADKAERVMDAMANEYGGYIPWPIS